MRSFFALTNNFFTDKRNSREKSLELFYTNFTLSFLNLGFFNA